MSFGLLRLGEIKWKSVFLRLMELAVGITFILSGFGKAMDAHAFGELISSYGMEWFSILSPVIIVCEIAVGMLLLLHVQTKVGSYLSMLMLIVFTCAFSYAYFVHGIKDCGCFGSLYTRLPVWAVYVRNILLFVMSCCIVRYGEPKNCAWNKASISIMLLVMTVAVFQTGHTWSLSTFYVNRFPQSHPLLGLEVSKTPLASYVDIPKDSTGIVWVFSYSCGGCLNSIENIKKYQKGVADRFIPLSVDEDTDGNMHQMLDIPFDAVNVGENLVGFIKVVPTLLYINEGRIRYVIEESVPSVYQFKRLYLNMSNQEIMNNKSFNSNNKNK